MELRQLGKSGLQVSVLSYGTGTFGGRSDPFTGEPGFHQGLDISAERGHPVYATADGKVESASNSGDYGNLVVIDHGFGLVTRYGHMSKFAVWPLVRNSIRNFSPFGGD